MLQILCEIYFVSLLVAQNKIDAKISKISKRTGKGVFFSCKSPTLPNPCFGHLQYQSDTELRNHCSKENKLDIYSLESLVSDLGISHS